MYKVLIPSAGLGTRLGEFSKNLNKALVTLDNKPVISHVIEKFPKHIELVIALGHKGDLLKQYLDLAHSDRKITTVNITNYQGSGSGLGLTILECEKHLQCPFIFCPNDTVILESIPEPDHNWVGFSNVKNNKNYRSFKIDKDFFVKNIYEKDEVLSFDTKPYIGLLGIKDYKKFWDHMKDGKNYGSIRVGESYGIRKLLEDKHTFRAKEFTWYDTGNLETLEIARDKLSSENTPEILEKPDEAIWFVNDRVIKYSKHKDFISDRVKRSEILKGYVPEVTTKSNNMYSYRMLNGQVISKVTNSNIFKDLLNYLEHFWELKSLNKDEQIHFKKVCNEFYQQKTRKRIQLYFDRFSQADEPEIINGLRVPKLEDLLKKVDWSTLSDGVPVRFHGDLHFENILVAETGDFFLLDWRQNFGGIYDYGDLYYDLSKILHGLIVSHELVNKECFKISHVDNVVSYDLYRKHSLVENERQFFGFLKQNDYDSYKVKLLTAIIFLNIAPLHHHPYSKMLFYLGKESLFNILQESPYDN